MNEPLSTDASHWASKSRSPAWGWKMLAVVDIANAAAIFVDDFQHLGNPFTLFWNIVSIFTAIGLSEYAFQKRLLPLAFWRFCAPAYAFYIASQMHRLLSSDSPVVIAVCGTIVLVASVVALARRARYLGPDRIPFGRLKPSLT